MAFAPESHKAAAYSAAKRFREAALESDGSMFEPDRSVWSRTNLEDLHRRFNDSPDDSTDSFVEKFARQLAGAPTATIQLAAELVYAYFIITMSVGGVTKRRLIDTIRGWANEPIEIPPELDAAFDTGIASTGIGYNTYRPNQLWLFIEALLAVKRLDAQARAAVIADPWRFKELLNDLPANRDQSGRNALLHLFFPDRTEPIVSQEHKLRILNAFGSQARQPLSADVDEALEQVRTTLEPEYGVGFYYYRSPVAQLWIEQGPTPVDEQEQEWRRQKFAQIRRHWLGDPTALQEWRDRQALLGRSSAAVATMLDELRATHDLASFVKQVRASPDVPDHVRSGPQSQFLKGLARASDPSRAAATLAAALAPPASDDEARNMLGELAALAAGIGTGGQPAPAMSPIVASVFWSLAEPERWQPLYESAESSMRQLGWLPKLGDPGERYLAYRDLLMTLSDTPHEATFALGWYSKHPWVGLDPTLIDRCETARAIFDEWLPERTYANESIEATASTNATAMANEVTRLAQQIESDVARILGRETQVARPPVRMSDSAWRYDAFASCQVGGANRPAIRVLATRDGVIVGLHPGWRERGWYDAARQLLEPVAPADLDFIDISSASSSHEQRVARSSGEFLLGRSYPGTTALDRVDLIEDISAATAKLQPCVDRLVGGGAAKPPPADELSGLVAQFRAVTQYPTAADRAQESARERFAVVLTEDALESFDVGAFREIIQSNAYGFPGPQPLLLKTLRQLEQEPHALDEFATAITDLLRGDGDDADRIDRLTNRFAGFAGSTIVKLLAVANPDRWIPVFPFKGAMGKKELMTLLGLTPPTAATRGQRQAQSNDAIREVLDPHFPGDPWGQSRFLYWLKDRDQQPAPLPDLESLADRLLVDVAFLDELELLVRDKGQIILYGPPGTGKTYLAREFARELAQSDTRFRIVQFHPSTSYEDFFEGFRPQSLDGDLGYTLVPGPLAVLADMATSDPMHTYVLLIDEINRANLPKVLGELLFLLEYRDEAVFPLYRPNEPFALPRNLLFIGTMNTADRSIALIDAAMRRRFHFVPFFPQEGAMAGLLRRFLEREGGPSWVADLLDTINEELESRLDGPHLQIGPSHFMRPNLDENQLQRIWTYNVFPYLEDQFFGEPEIIREYRWEVVLQRFNSRDEATESDIA